MDDHAYCASQVRDFDSDRYVTSLFAPAPRRADLLALYAFNLELARSRELVSEAALGRIRLQWWRDAIAECYEGGARRHQVVQPVAQAIERHDLPRKLFERIIDAREADFETSPPASLKHLIAYGENSSGALNLLAAGILGVRDDDLIEAAKVVGTAWTLAGAARGLRHLLLTGRQPLPQDLMEKYGLSHGELQSLKPNLKLSKLVEEISSISLELINETRTEKVGLATPVMLQAVLLRAYLKRLAITGYNPVDERNLHPLRYRAWRLMIPSLTGRM